MLGTGQTFRLHFSGASNPSHADLSGTYIIFFGLAAKILQIAKQTRDFKLEFIKHGEKPKTVTECQTRAFGRSS